MANKHTNIRRIIGRVVEELRATRQIARYTSNFEALHTLITKFRIQIMNRSGKEESLKIKVNLLKKHQIMNKYFEKTFSNFIQSYRIDKTVLNPSSLFKNCIWMCWWQGFDHAPEIVKKCIESVKKNAGECRVILLTEDNYQDYINLPEWLIQMRKKGIISRTHFSDVLRISLLARHGGMWLDATFLCVDAVTEYLQLPIWSIKRPDYGHISVACGNFANYSFGCSFEYRWVFAVIRDYLLEYWKTNDIMIDYLFLDYLIELIQRQHKDIAQLFSNIPPNNPHCDDLLNIINNPFAPDQWLKLNEDTCLFKLTWKQDMVPKCGEEDTFYGKLIGGML